MVTPPDMTVVTVYACGMQSNMSPQCKEFSEISATQLMSGLESLRGDKLTSGPCTHTSSYGGC